MTDLLQIFELFCAEPEVGIESRKSYFWEQEYDFFLTCKSSLRTRRSDCSYGEVQTETRLDELIDIFLIEYGQT